MHRTTLTLLWRTTQSASCLTPQCVLIMCVPAAACALTFRSSLAMPRELTLNSNACSSACTRLRCQSVNASYAFLLQLKGPFSEPIFFALHSGYAIRFNCNYNRAHKYWRACIWREIPTGNTDLQCTRIACAFFVYFNLKRLKKQCAY